jgi:hypothetical protein
MLRFSAAVALAGALAASASSAVAQSRIEVGVLECRGTTSSFIVGSVTELRCTFRPSGGGRGEPYSATIRRVGVDIGINEQTAVAWAVFAPTRQIGPGDLRGSYGGVSAGASVGVGVGANALVGGSNNTFALQPVSVQGQTGLSIAGGIAGLELRSGGR